MITVRCESKRDNSHVWSVWRSRDMMGCMLCCSKLNRERRQRRMEQARLSVTCRQQVEETTLPAPAPTNFQHLRKKPNKLAEWQRLSRSQLRSNLLWSVIFSGVLKNGLSELQQICQETVTVCSYCMFSSCDSVLHVPLWQNAALDTLTVTPGFVKCFTVTTFVSTTTVQYTVTEVYRCVADISVKSGWVTVVVSSSYHEDHYPPCFKMLSVQRRELSIIRPPSHYKWSSVFK